MDKNDLNKKIDTLSVPDTTDSSVPNTTDLNVPDTTDSSVTDITENSKKEAYSGANLMDAEVIGSEGEVIGSENNEVIDGNDTINREESTVEPASFISNVIGEGGKAIEKLGDKIVQEGTTILGKDLGKDMVRNITKEKKGALVIDTKTGLPIFEDVLAPGQKDLVTDFLINAQKQNKVNFSDDLGGKVTQKATIQDVIDDSLNAKLANYLDPMIVTSKDDFNLLVDSFMQTRKIEKVTDNELLDLTRNIGQKDLYDRLGDVLSGKNSLLKEEFYRGTIELSLINTRIQFFANKITDAKNVYTPKDAEDFVDLIGQRIQVTAALLKDSSDTGSKLRLKQKMDSDDVGALEEVTILFNNFLLNQEQGKNRVIQLASMISKLDSDKTGIFLNKYANEIVISKWRDVGVALGKGTTTARRAIAEIFVNSYLASPLSHIVNISSNAVFNVLTVAEYGIAAAINKIPFLETPDGIRFSEVYEMMLSYKDGAALGWHNGLKSIINNKPISGANAKLDLYKDQIIGSQLLGDKYKNSMLGAGLEAIGVFTTTPSRLLVGEDEFAKGIIYQQQLRRLSRREANFIFDRLRRKGVSVEEAKKQAGEVFVDSMQNPSRALIKKVENEMVEGTFNQPITNKHLKAIQDFAHIPEIKIFIPFYRTIVNIFSETNKRIPFLNLMDERTRKIFLGPAGPEKQLAIGKMISGAMMMSTMAYQSYGNSKIGDNTIILGMYPSSAGEREAWKNAGLVPYSIAKKQSDGSYKCYSFDRFEPVSALLAIGADIGYALTRPDGFRSRVDSLDSWALTKAAGGLDIFAAGAISLSTYMNNQPFIGGLGEVLDLVRIEDDYKFDKAVGKIVGQFASTTISFASGGVKGNITGNFGKYWLDMQGLAKRSSNITDKQYNAYRNSWIAKLTGDENMPGWMKQSYIQYNKLANNRPWGNENVPKDLTFWGEEMPPPIIDGVLKYVSPVRVSNTRLNIVDEWMKENGLNVTFNTNKIRGYDLTAEEEYDFIKNYFNVATNPENKLPGYEKTSDVLYNIMIEMQSKGFKNATPTNQYATDGVDDKTLEAEGQITIIQNIVSEAKKEAIYNFLRQDKYKHIARGIKRMVERANKQ